MTSPEDCHWAEQTAPEDRHTLRSIGSPVAESIKNAACKGRNTTLLTDENKMDWMHVSPFFSLGRAGPCESSQGLCDA